MGGFIFTLTQLHDSFHIIWITNHTEQSNSAIPHTHL